MAYTTCAWAGATVTPDLTKAQNMQQVWAAQYALTIKNDATCGTEARATDVLKSEVPDSFNAVITCYMDNSANSALLSVFALFSLIFLLF